MANAADPADKADIIARERRAWTNWWSHVADVDPAAIRPDGWSLKDVIAHLSAWQRHSSDRLATLGPEEPDPGPPETDVFNEQVPRGGALSLLVGCTCRGRGEPRPEPSRLRRG